MASSTYTDTPQIGGQSNSGNTPVTSIATPVTAVSTYVKSPATVEDLTKSHDLTPNGRQNKKPRYDSGRKEREEWIDTEIAILLDSFTEKYLALNRTLLTGKDWEVVADLVAEGCDKQSAKSIEQCKNKIDNLKKSGATSMVVISSNEIAKEVHTCLHLQI